MQTKKHIGIKKSKLDKDKIEVEITYTEGMFAVNKKYKFKYYDNIDERIAETLKMEEIRLNDLEITFNKYKAFEGNEII